ncbi:hypothetical protein [Pseudoalteromonas arctica]|uniref:Restriction endonuclease type IV Mrr domain-containing protein n=1 Tax=Pseudoalteromonas arctica A 37-1-2 TaxID=1117313 RepID=A0A290S236_9GAMM|nr:hypothetical protein [Pseudoalteromonas arctica]ATC85051.1 hypothetical protein PARC_a0299 [Pseudoalteromonas arctica A 37-1-2]
MTIKAEAVLFIKLGSKGDYERECIEKEGTIKLDYKQIPHELCLSNNWDKVSEFVAMEYNTNKASTTSHRNQIKKFYTEPKTTMWITFYDCKLWYCFAEEEVLLDESSRTKSRKTVGGWRSVDSQNNSLFIQALSGKLTKVQGFRGTICDVKEKEYLLNKINNTQHPDVKNVETNLVSLKLSLEKIIQLLSPQDFEVFVDLIFRSSGWSRVGSAGNTIKTLDIELLAPVTGERAIVQVKSQSNLSLYKEYEERLNIEGYDRAFYVTHTPDKKLSDHINSMDKNNSIQVWDAEKLADLSVNAGLIEWLVSTVG